MIVQFLLFVIAVELFSIFWELTKMNYRLKMLLPQNKQGTEWAKKDAAWHGTAVAMRLNWRNQAITLFEPQPSPEEFVLHFAYQNQLIHGKRIGVRAIQDAALKYYEEKVASYFADGRFLHETFAERCSIYSLKELLEQIVGRARELSSERSPRLLNPPTTRKEFA